MVVAAAPQRQAGMESGRRGAYSSTIVGLFALALYVTTIAPTMTWRGGSADGLNLAGAAYSLGIAHPPGYPLYTLLGHLFTQLPVGDVAYRLGVASAVAGAMAVGVTHWTARLFLRRAAPGAPEWLIVIGASATAASVALSRSLWSQAVVPEVYALNALLVAGLLGTGLSARQHRWALPVAAIVVGLILSHHRTGLLLIPAIAWLVWRDAEARPSRTALLRLAGLAIGVTALFHAYLPLRADQVPGYNWGAPASLDQIGWLVSGAQYHGMTLGVPATVAVERLLAWPAFVLRDVGLVFGALAFVGAWRLGERARPLGLFIVLGILPVLLWSSTYAGSAARQHLLPATIFVGLATGAGVVAGGEALRAYLAERRTRAALVVALLAAAVALTGTNVAETSARGDDRARLAGETVLLALPERAVVLEGDDEMLFALWYLQRVEGWRPDVTVISPNLMHWGWYRADLARLSPDVTLLPAAPDLAKAVSVSPERPIVIRSAERIAWPPGGTMHGH